MIKPINIIDLFAGPGGLGEGFSSLKIRNKSAFKIHMSVEKEASAHQTLTLRALYRSLSTNKEKLAYHDYVAGNITSKDLRESMHHKWEQALEETMDGPTALGVDNDRIHKKLHQLKTKYSNEPWIVIGGPPCQAYSLAGRSRNKGIKDYRAENDHRHFLYQEYLEVLNIIQPDVFVMENVKGILTSKVDGELIFPKIRSDLEHPAAAVIGKTTNAGKKYRIYSFSAESQKVDLLESKHMPNSSFIIRTENYGIPQARHRVILLGIWEDINKEPSLLETQPTVNIEHILTGLPTLRSKLSKGKDSPEAWSKAILKQAKNVYAESRPGNQLRPIASRMLEVAENLNTSVPTSSGKYKGSSWISSKVPRKLCSWLLDDPPISVLNHESRGHIPEDLGRYLFSSCWAEENKGGSISIPKAEHFPKVLHPNHANWLSGHFADRFRVQARGRPATTITSHISKDGHYYIHYDSKQCRSLTVREAARIQTFSDNYFFEGNRTQQYVQVGNAVPPYLSVQIAKIVYEILNT